MAEKKLNDIIIHCHFDGEPSQELIEALNRMADLAAKTLGTEINNGNTEKRVANCAVISLDNPCIHNKGGKCKYAHECYFKQFT